jgi:hypothetical protein
MRRTVSLHLIVSPIDWNADCALAAMANDPEAVKIKEWRHKLQRAFLRDGHPIEEAVRHLYLYRCKIQRPLQSLPEYDETFKIIENYEGLTVEYLSVRLVSCLGLLLLIFRNVFSIPRSAKL